MNILAERWLPKIKTRLLTFGITKQVIQLEVGHER